MPEDELVACLVGLPAFVSAVVLHPDQMEDPARYAPLGSRLLVENMDSRKVAGKDGDELELIFGILPEAGFCFDIAHENMSISARCRQA
ncbi:MAG: hypothetical protein ACM3N0_00250 [Chloroflexota bacterium]